MKLFVKPNDYCYQVFEEDKWHLLDPERRNNFWLIPDKETRVICKDLLRNQQKKYQFKMHTTLKKVKEHLQTSDWPSDKHILNFDPFTPKFDRCSLFEVFGKNSRIPWEIQSRPHMNGGMNNNHHPVIFCFSFCFSLKILIIKKIAEHQSAFVDSYPTNVTPLPSIFLLSTTTS